MTARRRIASRVLARRRTRTKFRLIISGHRDSIADYKDQLSNTDARIERIVEKTIDVPVPRVMGETV